MKILIVNASDMQGGAARAAYRLHKALLNQGIDSQMLVQDKVSDDETVQGFHTKIDKGLAKVRPTLDAIPIQFYPHKTKTLFSPSCLPFSKIVKRINDINPDIVHLHWICGGMLRIEDLAKIKSPIVWSLHDMWAFTGGCHYSEDCERYKENCGYCKVLNSNKKNDLSSRIFERKIQSFNRNDLTIVGLSRWLANAAKESYLFRNKKIVTLPNPIDIHLFKPFDKKKARQLWNLPENKKLLLFGAMKATSDPRKGYQQLMDSLQKLQNKDIELVIFGSGKPTEKSNFAFKSHYTSHVYDDISLVTLYSACDVTVIPSLQENLSNVIMESLSCGTPVVGFDIGGNGDMITHYKNGYLAKPFDTDDLAKGIEWILEDKERYQDLCFSAREKVVENFDSRKVAKQYLNLYKEIGVVATEIYFAL
jgi:glycosyltransferase involved in cell wall biosynthesis